MGKNHIFSLIIYSLLFCAIFYMVNPSRVNATTLDSAQESKLQLLDGDVHQDASPTPEISLTETAGRGEGLIFIASIIVLIILAGVIFSSRRRK